MALRNMFSELGLDSSITEIKGMLRSLLIPLQQLTGAGSNRLSVDVNAVGTIGTVTTVTGVTTVAAVTTVGNQTNLGGMSAFELQKAISHNTFSSSVRPILN